MRAVFVLASLAFVPMAMADEPLEQRLLLRIPLFESVDGGRVTVGWASDVEVDEEGGRVEYDDAYHLGFLWLSETNGQERVLRRSDLYGAVSLPSRVAREHYENQMISTLRALGPRAFIRSWGGYDKWENPFIVAPPLTPTREQMYGQRSSPAPEYAYKLVFCLSDERGEDAHSMHVESGSGSGTYRNLAPGTDSGEPVPACESLRRAVYAERVVVDSLKTTAGTRLLEIAATVAVRPSEQCAPIPVLETQVAEDAQADPTIPTGETRKHRLILTSQLPVTAYEPGEFEDARAVYLSYTARVKRQLFGDARETDLDTESTGEISQVIGYFPCEEGVDRPDPDLLIGAIVEAFERSQEWIGSEERARRNAVRVAVERALERRLQSGNGRYLMVVCSRVSDSAAFESANLYVDYDEAVIPDVGETCQAIERLARGPQALSDN